MIAKYVLIVEEFPLALQIKVDELICRGYSPLGGASACHAGRKGQRYAQAMISNDEVDNKAVTLYDCGHCPCFDVHYLEKCSLGYTVQFKQKDDKGYFVSSDCRLLEIRTKDKVITPMRKWAIPQIEEPNEVL